jgi:hypothetical protein
MQPPPYTNRDYGIEEIRACKNHRYYGMGLGIVISDDVYPGFPGDVRNARALQREIDIPLFIPLHLG